MDQKIRNEPRPAQPFGWIAGIAAIVITAGIAFAGLSGDLGPDAVLWSDAAIVLTAAIGLLAWIVASALR